MSSPEAPTWRAHANCPENVRYIVERIVNAFPPEWLEEPATGEVFSGVEECERRLNAYALSQGFMVVKSHSTKTPIPSTTFSCIHYGKATRNTRILPSVVERDEEGVIIGERKRNHINVH